MTTETSQQMFLLVPVSIWPGAFAILATNVPAISWYQWFQAMVDFQLIQMSCGKVSFFPSLPGRDGFKAVTLSIVSVNSWKTEISPATKFLSIVLRFSFLSSSSLLCSAEDCRGRDCHPTGHSLFRTCKIPKSFHQANTTHCPYHFIVKATLSHSQANVCILDDQYHAAMPPCHQFWFSTCPISKRTETSPIFTAVLRQPRETLSSYWTLFVSNMQST